MMSRIYTRNGDDGYTRLADGTKISKSSDTVSLIGTIDELCAIIGICINTINRDAEKEILKSLLTELNSINADIARTPKPSQVEQRNVKAIEAEIDRYTSFLPRLTSFVLPCSSLGSANLHLARAVCRRAERELVAINSCTTKILYGYFNRLSDLFFVLARNEVITAGQDEIKWNPVS